MTLKKYQYRLKTPFGEATYRNIEDVLQFVRLMIRQLNEITIIREEIK